MSKNKSIQMSLFGLVAFVVSFQASALVVGNTNQGNSDPFGFYNDTGVYQQVYSSHAFPKLIEISSLTFYDFYNNPGDSLSATKFNIYLSTTSAAVGDLNPTLADNIGPDETLVYSGLPPAESNNSGSNEFVFKLSTDFIYNPASGNLLLNVTIENPAPYNPAITYLSADSSGIFMSRGLSPSGDLATTDSVGLVTGFNVAPVSAPEPTSLSLTLAGGITWGCALFAFRRYRNRRV